SDARSPSRRPSIVTHRNHYVAEKTSLNDHLPPIMPPTGTSTPAPTHASPATCNFRLKRDHCHSPVA
ncbi:hypothetical protein, partial [Streptomyces sp. M2CJ-2]|uniref:hypothetical protein n=1 Tax=Streptomyces sp. M2CJ-2 TaxID=2803948 RepID=UPI001F1B6C72